MGDDKEITTRYKDEDMDTVEEQIERFRKGDKLLNSDDFIINGQPDQKAVESFAQALRKEKDPVRKQIARLLVNMGQKVDPLYNKGGRLVRDRQIVSVLVEEGLAQHGTARGYSFDALHSFVPVELLKEHEGSIVWNVKNRPHSAGLLVIAKGKFASAISLVEDLVRSPQWGDAESVYVARAALGHRETEKRYIDSFLSTRSPAEKALLAETLGFIGTPAALKALAKEMRTDLIFVLTGSYRKSVRLDIISALSFNYPDKTFLYDNAILDESGYDRVERFCEETFGIIWEKPRPQFLTIEGFPLPR